MRKNQEYKNAALAALKGNWPQSIVATFIVLVLPQLSVLIALGVSLLCALGKCSMAISYCIVALAIVLYVYMLMMPCVVGVVNAFNALFYKSDSALLTNMKRMTFFDYFRNVAGMFLLNLVTFVCSLALIVPGVIVSMSLFLVPYLLHDNPDLSLVDTMRLSRKMMRGHKMQLFKLSLSFIGWGLLNSLTLGVGVLWLMPYIMTTMAAFYQDVREQYFMKGGLQGSAA